jgi:hypothetical protein
MKPDCSLPKAAGFSDLLKKLSFTGTESIAGDSKHPNAQADAMICQFLFWRFATQRRP